MANTKPGISEEKLPNEAQLPICMELRKLRNFVTLSIFLTAGELATADSQRLSFTIARVCSFDSNSRQDSIVNLTKSNSLASNAYSKQDSTINHCRDLRFSACWH